MADGSKTDGMVRPFGWIRRLVWWADRRYITLNRYRDLGSRRITGRVGGLSILGQFKDDRGRIVLIGF